VDNKSFILPCSGMGINVDRCPAVMRALKAEEAAPSTDVQQLKHEIASIADSLYKEFVEHKVYVSYVTAVVDRLRQLSCG